MEENTQVRPRRRRRKTKMEIFKEAYLPYLILLLAVVLILVMIIGAVTRGRGGAQDATAWAVSQTAEV